MEIMFLIDITIQSLCSCVNQCGIVSTLSYQSVAQKSVVFLTLLASFTLAWLARPVCEVAK